MKITGVVHEVLTGRSVPYTNAGTLSAIDKKSVNGSTKVSVEGLDGDEQGDHLHHGGIDKAVHFYVYEHYNLWRNELGGNAVLGAAGAFGENISTVGVTESDLCMGDQLLIGTVLLEISQTRQPCWKLNYRFSVQNMAQRVQQSLRTGFYCRVLKPGALAAGDAIKLVARPYPDWPLQRFIALLYHDMLDRDALTNALELPLVPSNRKIIEDRLASNQVECWLSRIEAPADDDA